MTDLIHLISKMTWLSEPDWEFEKGILKVKTKAETDYWQKTHYGFSRDSGHALLKRVDGNFLISARFRFSPNSKYDQCGLLLRIDENNWFKCSVEYENEHESKLGSVLTLNGYSDWATQEIRTNIQEISYRLLIKNSDITAKYSYDGIEFFQMRIAHFPHSEKPLLAGLYGCSPIGNGFDFSVENFLIDDF